MGIEWVTAFIDHPAAGAGDEVRFWQMATGSGLSARRGDRGQFATLLTPSGDPYLRVQETDDGSAGVHIDLHVTDVAADVDRAVALGATVMSGAGTDLVLLQSPAGMPFCFVAAHEPARRPAPFDGPVAPSLVDQVSIDIPAGFYADECAFWSNLTGWDLHGGAIAGFRVLARPPQVALRILLQALGEDDAGMTARAHLDLAVGENGEALAIWHKTLGATLHSRGRRWITMLDPAGLPYCLTERELTTGQLPPNRR